MFAGDPARAPSPAPPERTAEPKPPRAPAMDYADDRIPESARARIRRILACLREAEVLMEREELQASKRSEVELIRDEHLPKLVRSYVDIPPAHRAEIFRKTGKSASFILDESLDTIQGRVDEILRLLAQHDLEAFENNAAFINRRYTADDPFG
jgi:hypothetical protein